jgi:hypothetical protein
MIDLGGADLEAICLEHDAGRLKFMHSNELTQVNAPVVFDAGVKPPLLSVSGQGSPCTQPRPVGDILASQAIPE